jgi:hypothetical protein
MLDHQRIDSAVYKGRQIIGNHHIGKISINNQPGPFPALFLAGRGVVRRELGKEIFAAFDGSSD